MRTTIMLEHEPAAAGHLVRLLLRLEGDPPAGTRAPLNLSLVLDRSGSMSGAKLAAAREAAALLVRRLAPADVVSVVAYDDEVTVVAPPTTGSSEPDLAARIARIHSGGMTNLSGGWLRGREFVSQRRETQPVNRVLLLTDGLANVGITEPDQLVSMCQSAKHAGVTTTTIGFGEDYDEQLLRAMADAGGGGTYYIERPDQAPAIFAHELEGLLGIAAQNLRVEVRPADTVRLAAVHHEYPRVDADGGTLRLELGDLYPREPKSLLCEFMVSDVVSTGSIPVATLVVTADVLCERGVEHQRIELPVTVSPSNGPEVNPEVQRELLLLEAARARREALDAERAGDYEGGRRRLEAMRVKLEASGLADEVVLEETADLHHVAALYAAEAVTPADRKYLFQRSYNRASGRAVANELIRRKRPDQEA